MFKIGERIYQLCRTGKLGGAGKVGNQWRVEKQELLSWLKAGGDAEFRTTGDGMASHRGPVGESEEQRE